MATIDELLRGGPSGQANQQLIDAARAAQRTKPATSTVASRPAANPTAAMARDLGGGPRPVPPKSPMGGMADDLLRNARASAPPTPPPTGPANPSFAGGGGSPEARAWQASRTATAPATAPSTAATAASKGGMLRNVAGSMMGANPVGLAVMGTSLMASDPQYTNTGVSVGDATRQRMAGLEKAGLVKLTPPGGQAGVAADPSTPASRGLETLARTGVTQDPSIGGGRSRVLDTTNYKDLTTPGPSAFDRTADVRSSIETGVTPKTLQDGRVWRSGNSYTGMDVKEGAGFADAKTGMNYQPRGTTNPSSLSSDISGNEKLAKAAQTGDTKGLSDLQKRQVALLRDGGRFDASGNIMTRQTQETFERAAQRQAEAQRGGLRDGASAVNQQWVAFEKAKASGAFEKQPGEGLKQYANRMDAMTKMLGVDMDDLGNQRTNSTSRANNAETNDTTRRGQDMTAAEKAAERQIAAQKRALMSKVAEASGGNPRVMADMMLRAGYSDDAKAFFDLFTDAQGSDIKATDNAKNLLRGAMETDGDGNIMEGSEAAVLSAAAQATPGFATMSPQEQIANLPTALAAGNIISGMNQTADNSFLPNWLTGNDPARLSTLPGLDETKGGKMENVGMWEAFVNNNVARGDKALRLPNGQTRYLPQGRVNQNERELLRSMGIDIGQIK